MKFDERLDGDYRIYAGALDVLRGDGYIAAVVVSCTCSPHTKGLEVFRDESLACGHRWPTADEALMFALCKAREWIGQQQLILQKLADRRLETAEALLQRARVASSRIERGIKLLETPQVLEAFRLANQSMAMQAKKRQFNWPSHLMPTWCCWMIERV